MPVTLRTSGLGWKASDVYLPITGAAAWLCDDPYGIAETWECERCCAHPAPVAISRHAVVSAAFLKSCLGTIDLLLKRELELPALRRRSGAGGNRSLLQQRWSLVVQQSGAPPSSAPRFLRAWPAQILAGSALGGGGDRVGEMLVLLAAGAADSFDDAQLGLGAAHVALCDISLAEIFAHLRVTGRQRDRFQVIADSLVEPAELPRRIAAIIERLRGIRVAQQVERRERFIIALGLGERVSVVPQDLVGERTPLLDTAPAPLVPDFAAWTIGIGAAAAAPAAAIG